MKKLILIIALCLGMAVFAQAQTAKKNPGKMPKALAAKLNLTADQEPKVTAIWQKRAARMDSLNSDSVLTKKAARPKRAEINTSADAQLNTILTPDQQKIYADFKEQQKDKRKNKTAPVATPPGE
jgi:protein CpxP